MRGSVETERRYREPLTLTSDHVAAAATALGVLGSAFALVHLLQLTALLAVVAVALLTYRDEVAARLGVDPTVDVTKHVRPGLSDKEVQEFFTLHQEYLEMQEEKRKEMERKAEQRSGSAGSLNTQ